MMSAAFQSVHSIEEVLSDFRQGKMVILVDDEDRENEGDLVMAAEAVTADHINFMASHGRGLICLTLTEERCQQLELPLMVSRNNARFSTNFTVSIEAAEGVTTGISAQDRAITVRAAVKRNAGPGDLVTPGHIFPIKAQPGGVLTRAGHTEAGVDLARLSGFEPASVICEILREDGTMARLPDLLTFARQHELKIGTIADLIKYRLRHEPTLERVDSRPLDLEQGRFEALVYHDVAEGGTHLALTYGNLQPGSPVPVRVQVHRGLLDSVLEAGDAESWSIASALDAIAGYGSGALVLLAYHEEAGELASRIQIRGERKRSASKRKDSGDPDGSPRNLRMLGAGSQILADLGLDKILSLGREWRTFGLSGFGLEVVEYLPDRQALESWANPSAPAADQR
jgi:3,4-dihydroxy 2-butanone 4-phosphate synthase/GTP cyclohydrolase II